MNMEPLTTFVNQLRSIDEERARIAHAAFRWLSQTDQELWGLAVDAFDSENKAALWFAEESAALGDQMPLAALTLGGRSLVENCLNQIRFGMFS